MQRPTILDLFEQNELNISRLYRLYSQRLGEKKDFWEQISREEIQHALDIRNSYKGKEDIFKESSFSRGTIKYVSDFVLESVEKAQKGEFTHAEALESALRIEQSFLEKKCFDIFIPNNKKVQEVLKKLNKETEEHIKRLQVEYKKVVK